MIQDWTQRLSQALAETLTALRSSVGSATIARLAVDCHPWDGMLCLAILTQDALDADPELADPAEMAAWDLYDCGESVKAWTASAGLAADMKTAYDEADDPADVADRFLNACAHALKSQVVQKALSGLQTSDGFRITVTHPDTDHEYFS